MSQKLLQDYTRAWSWGSYAPKNGGCRTPLLLKNLSLPYSNEPLNNTVCVIFYVDNNSNSIFFFKIKPITNKSSRYLHRPMFILRSQTGYTLYPFWFLTRNIICNWSNADYHKSLRCHCSTVLSYLYPAKKSLVCHVFLCSSQDSKENSEQFPRQFVKGAGQGFWWSFISMTTVG